MDNPRSASRFLLVALIGGTVIAVVSSSEDKCNRSYSVNIQKAGDVSRIPARL
jgi:hypothetical protein